MFKSILVTATGGDDAAVFETALLAAKPFSAHIDFLHIRPDVTETMMAMASAGMGMGITRMDQSMTDRMTADAERFASQASTQVREFCASHGVALDAAMSPDAVTASYLEETGTVSQCLLDHGRFADLLLTGSKGPSEGALREMQEAALMETGRPVLIAPATPPASLLGTVMIAWKDSTESNRAVMAALPFLQKAERVMVLSVLEVGEEPDAGPENRLLRLLRRHNPNTVSLHLAEAGRQPVDLLLDATLREGATMLVMGGYGHSRVREALFGGFTKSVLDGVNFPVFMMH